MRRMTRPGRDVAWAVGVMILAACMGCPTSELPKIVTFTDPMSADEHARLGAIYEREGNIGRAIEEYTAALKSDPENLVALTGLGNVSFQQGKPKTAAGYYMRALDLDPDNLVLWNNLAMAWTLAKKPKKALEAAERAVALDGGKDPRILDTRARAKALAGDGKGERDDLATALALCELYGEDALGGACVEIREQWRDLE